MAIGGNAGFLVIKLTIEVDVGPAVFQCCFGSIIHSLMAFCFLSPWGANAYFVSLYTRNMQYSFILQGYTDKLPLWILGEILKVGCLTSIKTTIQSTIIVNEISKWLTMKYFIIDNLLPMHPLLSHYPISFINYLFSWVSFLFSLALFRIFIAYVVCFKIHINWLDLLFTTNGWDHKAYNIVMFLSILYFFLIMLVLIIHSLILVKIFFLLSPNLSNFLLMRIWIIYIYC